jgi:hypothetical protein
MNRRRLLQALAFAPGCVTSGASRALSDRSDTDGDTLLAFAEALLGTGALSMLAREVLLEHLVLRSQADTDLRAQYRACERHLDRRAGVPFSTLSIGARQDLIARLQAAGDDAAREIRTSVVPDLIAAYYRSPLGWAAVGYTSAFPGHCAGLVEYTRAPT